MKRSLLIAAIACILFAPFASRAQFLIKLPDLERLCVKNGSDFETFVLTNGYSLNGKQSNQVTKAYRSDKPNADGKLNTVSRSQVPNAAAKIEFVTTDKEYYLDLKNLMAKSGYKFVKEENRTVNGVASDWYDFASNKYKVSLSSNTTDVTWYTVQIHL